MNAGMRGTMKLALRLCVSSALITWFLFHYDLKELLGVFGGLALSVWLLGCAMYLAAQVLSSVRWWILAESLDFEGPWRSFLSLYFIGMYFNLFLPTGLGGDVFKVHFLSRVNGERMRAAFTVLGDRLAGLIAMVLLGLGAVCAGPSLLPRKLVVALLCAAAVLAVAMVALPFLFRSAEKWRPKLAERMAPLLVLRKKPVALAKVIGLSFFLQALGMGTVALLGRGLGIGVPLNFYFAAVPLVVLLTLLPVSFNGIGIREGAFVFFFGLQGVRPEASLALALLSFSIQVTVSLIGGILYAVGAHR